MKTRIRSSLSAQSSQILLEASGLPSSINNNSKSGKDCSKMLLIHLDKVFSALYIGTITEILHLRILSIADRSIVLVLSMLLITYTTYTQML